jgi:hypothetical protein
MQYIIVEKPSRVRNTEKAKEYTGFLKKLTTLPENQAAKQTFQNRTAATNKAQSMVSFESRKHILKDLGYKLHISKTHKGNQFSIFYFATKIKKEV